jgi:hypothetical protein
MPNKRQTRKNLHKQMRIKFRTNMLNVVPIHQRVLSKNGPYFDAHFGKIDNKNPIGQTYYLRPITVYNPKTKILTIKLNKKQPTIHMNSNSVTNKVCYEGTIKITDFQYEKHNPLSEISVDIIMYNNTGKRLIGLHIHEGELADKGPYAGFTNFGPILYFIRTTAYWNKKKSEKAFPLPEDDVTPITDFTLI